MRISYENPCTRNLKSSFIKFLCALIYFLIVLFALAGAGLDPKNPSLTVYLHRNNESKKRAQEIMNLIEFTCLKDITAEASIYFDPDDMNTLIEHDKLLMEEYREFNKLMEDCLFEEEHAEKSKWVIRFKLDRETMLDKNITMDDVYFALKNSYKDNSYAM